ncbi:MAG: hypothetical protein JWR21_925 [Herminiimonas sp.]|nr:hypothetical protein [Herminiimonas sp.]
MRALFNPNDYLGRHQALCAALLVALYLIACCL